MQKKLENAENLYFFVLGMAEDTPALLDGVIDSSHRSFLSVVQRERILRCLEGGGWIGNLQFKTLNKNIRHRPARILRVWWSGVSGAISGVSGFEQPEMKLQVSSVNQLLELLL